MEPFTTLAIQLQGGKFDHADRMFSDIGATWKGVLEDMSDVKELVRYNIIKALSEVPNYWCAQAPFCHLSRKISSVFS